jgi:lactate 2-monooxygenase
VTDFTRRQFLETAGTAVAASFLAPTALAGAQSPGSSPLPVGPGAAYVGYQSEIYIAGMGAGRTPIFTTNLSALERLAANVLSEQARRHLLEWAGGAAAARANEEGLDAWRIVPRMFIDRAQRDLSANVLGTAMPAPVILGPVGNQALVHPDGEIAAARVAAELGLTYVQAAQASRTPEQVATAAPRGSRWFALDWPGAKPPDAALLKRAADTRCTHLVLGAPQPGEDWAPLTAVRAAWSGPILLNGVQTVADARAAVAQGIQGIVVSNERGRRGTGTRGTLDALPKIVDAVNGKAAVLFGAGVRTGSDVYKALALGAEAVLVGRPYVHGLALGGEPGVKHVLRTLLAELDITLAIAGIKSYRDLDASALIKT